MRHPFKTILFLLPLLFAQAAYGGIDSDLLEAAKAGDTAKVEQLLEQGADVNAKDKNGKTALMNAAFNGHTGSAMVLLEAGADVNAKDKNGWTALIEAVNGGHTETVKALMDAGADVNAKEDEYGMTALTVAAEKGHAEIVEILKQAGAVAAEELLELEAEAVPPPAEEGLSEAAAAMKVAAEEPPAEEAAAEEAAAAEPPAERVAARKRHAEEAAAERVEMLKGVAKEAAAEEEYSVVDVYYATDREKTDSSIPSDYYSGNRDKRRKLNYGICEVSIPKEHTKGELESPWFRSVLGRFRGDPTEHVVLLTVSRSTRKYFFASLSDKMAAASDKSALVFIHGYNVSFEDAARRTAQMAHDLEFPGVPLMYSWPSDGKKIAYSSDLQDAEWTVPRLKKFLLSIAKDTGAEDIHIIAHSMGNQALTRAFHSIFQEVRDTVAADGRKLFTQIFLAAPDIDADVFRDLSAAFTSLAEHTTLYCSEKDKALLAAREYQGGYPRAGDKPIIIDGIDTIDASLLDTSFIGHSYYGDHVSVISHIIYVITKNLPPAKKLILKKIDTSEGAYWKLIPTTD
jgi:esterase/lipase superfamily enzyme